MISITDQILGGAPEREVCFYPAKFIAKYCGLTEEEVKTYAHLLGNFYVDEGASFHHLAFYFVLAPVIQQIRKVPHSGREAAYLVAQKLPDGRMRDEGFLRKGDCARLFESFDNIAPQIEHQLNRVRYCDDGLVEEIFLPTRTTDDGGPLTVSVHSLFNFGEPAIAGRGLCIEAIHGRFMAGESPEALATDFDCPLNLINDAIRAVFLLESVEVDD